ncbi:hypothetical protein [Burkholderia pyrrocinia]|uniref:hypothetical protein n=1 Tax=Burkholderia pyrrocinia TaxID=60550 RepID=UPI00158B7F43|nr:hypothetical protein [Burkholderia pyrrocinia]
MNDNIDAQIKHARPEPRQTGIHRQPLFWKKVQHGSDGACAEPIAHGDQKAHVGASDQCAGDAHTKETIATKNENGMHQREVLGNGTAIFIR